MHRITLDPGGSAFDAGEETILNAALRQGVALPYGCRDGQCGACKAQVLAGEIEYPEGAKTTALSDTEARRGYCLCCQARARSDLILRIPEAGGGAAPEVRTLPARVARLERLSHDVMGIWLQLPSSERLVFRAGQYIEILMRDGRQRAYSLANAPHDDEFLQLHVRHYPGGVFAEYAFHALKARELLRIRGPYGSFCMREDSGRPAVFVAGGTGFAPIKAVLEHAFAKGVPQPLRLYWGVRATRDLYSPLPRQWAAEHANFSWEPVLSEPLAEDHWGGCRGLVHETLAARHPDLSTYDIYTCGPPVMTKSVADVAIRHGAPAERIYSDAFEFAAK
ncbi:MAG: CDP-6-deoxy-L-threo-D-glycero-4-hexulose-3-dehydrase reductase [Gammaproteobacteria bacterium]|nr:CDP-6-deoxy-L-threo-D-glycero-4-hexulose-3-dehydrase reductase [Gammaproteobacteria bacterium]